MTSVINCGSNIVEELFKLMKMTKRFYEIFKISTRKTTTCYRLRKFWKGFKVFFFFF